MPAYFDSSVLLSILKNDQHAFNAASLWAEHEERVSSLLIAIECRIVLRRAAEQFKSELPKDWLPHKESLLKKYLLELDLKPVDETVNHLVDIHPVLAKCRSLDAIHLATAVYFGAFASDFHVCTFDEQMKHAAKKMGFRVLPGHSE